MVLSILFIVYYYSNLLDSGLPLVFTFVMEIMIMSLSCFIFSKTKIDKVTQINILLLNRLFVQREYDRKKVRIDHENLQHNTTQYLTVE